MEVVIVAKTVGKGTTVAKRERRGEERTRPRGREREAENASGRYRM